MRKIILLPIILALALLALSCHEENPPTGPEGWQETTSPFNVLWNVCYCFHNQSETDIVKKFSALLSDDFIFYFKPDDIGDDVGGYVIPTFWTKDEFMIAINNMFNHAYSLDFDIPILEQGEEAFGRPAEGDTTFSKNNVTISFILMVDSTNSYMVQGFCDFKFSRGENGQWYLSEWRDHTAQLLCTDPSSLGHVLAMFR